MPASPVSPAGAFVLRSASLTTVVFQLESADLAALRAALEAQAGLLEHEPVLVDFARVREAAADVEDLLALLREHGMVPVAARGGSEAQMAAARAAGLIDAPEGQAGAAPATPAKADAAPAEPAPVPVEAPPPLIVDKPLRSGQQVYARGTDLVVLGLVSHGAEVIADGHIHVYAPLRGRAIAGARGRADARIFTTCLEAQLVSIAGTYRTTETPLPADVQGKPAQVRLDGERLVVEPLNIR